MVGGTPIDLAKIETPMLVIALKDDHVSAWQAVYSGARHLGAEFVLGGSGHNAGVINPPSRNKHGYWTGSQQLPDSAEEWLSKAAKNEGSWWPWWTKWLTDHGSKKQVAARKPEKPIEPAPGSYAMMD